jgi:beta-glucanase (GH16 family)
MHIKRNDLFKQSKFSLFFLFAALFTNPLLLHASDDFTPSHSSWKITFSEDFNDSRLDEKKWKIIEDKIKKKAYLTKSRSRKNIMLKDGILSLMTYELNKNADGSRGFTTGYIRSIFTQKYGFFSARCKYLPGSNINNAFWLFTVKPPSKKDIVEIDINEGHYPGSINTNIHTYAKGHISRSKKIETGMDLSKEYHVYSLEWSPEKIIWYFDGIIIRETVNQECNAPLSINLSTMALGKWNGEAIPQYLNGKSMDIDWVRAYKRIPSPPEIADKNIQVSEINKTNALLKWNKAGDDRTAPKDIIYKIYYSTTPMKSIPDIEKNAHMFTKKKGGENAKLTGLRNGETYYANIIAEDSAGEKSRYAECKFLTPKSQDNKTPALDKPDLHLKYMDDGSIILSWQEAKDETDKSSELAYRIYISKDASRKAYNLVHSQKGINFYKFKSLKGSPKCCVTVSDSSGNKTAYNEIKIKTDDPPIYSFPPNCKSKNTLKYDDLSLLSMDGKNNSIELPDLNLNTNNVTISLLLLPSGEQNEFTGIIFAREPELLGLQYGDKKFNRNVIYRWDSGPSWDWNSGLKIPCDQLSRITLTISPDAGTVYLKQKYKFQKAGFKGFHEKMSLNKLKLGQDPHSKDRLFSGKIGALSIYDRALTEEEVKNLPFP